MAVCSVGPQSSGNFIYCPRTGAGGRGKSPEMSLSLSVGQVDFL